MLLLLRFSWSRLSLEYFGDGDEKEQARRAKLSSWTDRAITTGRHTRNISSTTRKTLMDKWSNCQARNRLLSWTRTGIDDSNPHKLWLLKPRLIVMGDRETAPSHRLTQDCYLVVIAQWFNNGQNSNAVYPYRWCRYC